MAMAPVALAEFCQYRGQHFRADEIARGDAHSAGRLAGLARRRAHQASAAASIASACGTSASAAGVGANPCRERANRLVPSEASSAST